MIVSGDADLLALNPFCDIPDYHAGSVRAERRRLSGQGRWGLWVRIFRRLPY
jgi:hypothetical protein